MTHTPSKPSNGARKLIEVAIPLQAINRACQDEKNIHTGLPANLHTWWARRPAAACRAVLFCSLVDDPGEETQAAKARRRELFRLIERLVRPEAVDDPETLAKARKEILAATRGNPPAVYDPFCGGGAIPIEAARLGLFAYASDLNPVALLLTKIMVEILPAFARRPPVHPGSKLEAGERWMGIQGVSEDVEYYSNWVLDQARGKLESFYPNGPRGEPTIAWIWARTVRCPNPACRGLIPLLNTMALSTHAANPARLQIQPASPSGEARFDVVDNLDGDLAGTVNRKGALCPLCKTSVRFDYIRDQGANGLMGFQLVASVRDAATGRTYHPATVSDESTAGAIKPDWTPDSNLPEKALGFRVQRYGLVHHSDLFTPRQLSAITVFSDLVAAAHARVLADAKGDRTYATAITILLAFAVDRLAQTNNTLVRWLVRKTGTSKGTPAFDRQIVSMIWHFSEGNVFGESVGSWKAAVANVRSGLQALPGNVVPGKVFQADARSPPALNGPLLVCTDPPYFANVGFSDLSDFYYIWLRRTLKGILPAEFSTLLVPKSEELVANPHRFGDDWAAAEAFFLDGMTRAFHGLRDLASEDYPITVFYAFKESGSDEDEADDGEGAEPAGSSAWEKMLGGLINAGLAIVATWPVQTEQKRRMRAIESNALASSIVLACRTRPGDAPVASRRDFVVALKRELPGALSRLQQANIAPVDLAQAAIGPGIACFSRYSRILEPDGSPMSVRTALQLINQELETFLKQTEGETDAETQFCVSWFEQYGLKPGPFGEADILARAKSATLERLVRASALSSRAGTVMLLPRENLEVGWQPSSGGHPCLWECAQHVLRNFEANGEESAAELCAALGPGISEQAKNLTYRLFSICEKRGWAEDARPFNELVAAWPEIAKKAANRRGAGAQRTLPVTGET